MGTVVFFLFSIGIAISALRIIGNLEEGRKEIEGLTTSLEERNAELTNVKEERATLEKELEGEREQLERERRLKEKLHRELNQKITELQGEVRREKEEKAALERGFEELKKERAGLEERYQKARQALVSLEVELEEPPPGVEEQVVEVLPPEIPPVLVGGEVVSVAGPFLSLELDREVVAGIQPILSIYRRDELIKKLASQGIRGATLVARVAPEEDLEGIRKNDQVALGFSPDVAEMFILPYMEGEILDVIRPGFLNINLGREGLEDVQPILSVYRDGELFRKIELKDLNHLTILVEAVEEVNVRGIRERDRVKLTR